MATSDTAIANLALQKLGAARIASFDEDSKNAREIDACYAHIRNSELRRHNWNFARRRTTLAPSSTTPDFDYDYAFPVPSDFLCLRPPSVNELDWRLESHEGQVAILTSDGDTLEIVYTAKVTDPTKYDPSFAEMLACRIAEHLAEAITQSNTKKRELREDYKNARAEARRNNAFENISEEPPEDPWLAARR